MLNVILTIVLSLVFLTAPVEAKIIDCVATAYTAAQDECGRDISDPNYGLTASGEFVREGFIAADTDLLPMHSLVYIFGAGKFNGLYEVKDTGGAIKGNRIDIYVPTKKEAFDFGKRNVKVYILRKGKFMEFRKFYAYKGYTDVKLPERQTKYSAGYDFFLIEDVLIKPHSLAMLHTGVCVQMPNDNTLELFARSSLCKMGLILPNGVGLVDADYKEEIMFPIYNLTDNPVVLKKGSRIGQGVFRKYYTCGDVVESVRIGGFGSTN